MARPRSPVSIRREGDTRVDGLEDMQRRADALPEAIRANLTRAMAANGKALVKRLKAIAPREKGDLLGSIQALPGDGPISVMVVAGNKETPGPNVEYGHLAPDGSHVKPVPFFWPAYRVEKKGIRNRTNRALNAGIKAALGTGSKAK